MGIDVNNSSIQHDKELSSNSNQTTNVSVTKQEPPPTKENAPMKTWASVASQPAKPQVRVH